MPLPALGCRVHIFGSAHSCAAPEDTACITSCSAAGCTPSQDHVFALTLCAACRAGEKAPLAFSLIYAAPEVVTAFVNHESSIVASEAADMWSMGVIAYELLTGEPAMPPGATRQSLIDALTGKAKLPWEAADAATLRKLMRLRGVIMQCLHRDPAKRPSAEQVRRLPSRSAAIPAYAREYLRACI